MPVGNAARKLVVVEMPTWQQRLRRMGEPLLSPSMNNRQAASAALLVKLLKNRDLRNEMAMPLWKLACDRIIAEIIRSHNQAIVNKSFVAPDTWARAQRRDRALRLGRCLGYVLPSGLVLGLSTPDEVRTRDLIPMEKDVQTRQGTVKWVAATLGACAKNGVPIYKQITEATCDRLHRKFCE